MQVDPLFSDYTSESRLTLVQINHIDWVMQVDLLGLDYTCDLRLSYKPPITMAYTYESHYKADLNLLGLCWWTR